MRLFHEDKAHEVLFDLQKKRWKSGIAVSKSYGMITGESEIIFDSSIHNKSRSKCNNQLQK